MIALEALRHNLTLWLGLKDALDLISSPTELVFEDGPNVWLEADGTRDQIVLSSLVPIKQPLTQKGQIFLLQQNNPTRNQSGMVIGAHPDSGLITISRRFDAATVDQGTFEHSVLGLVEMAKATAAASRELDEAPIRDVLMAQTRIQGPQRGVSIDILTEGLKPTAFALQRVRGDAAALSFAECDVIVEAVGAEYLVSATWRSWNAYAATGACGAQMLLRNLFLAKCRSAGFFLDDENQPGAFALFALTGEAETAFGAATASAVGDLMQLPGLEPFNKNVFMQLPPSEMLIKV